MQGDVLTDVLRAVRMSGAIFFDVHAKTPWVAQTPASREFAQRILPDAQHVFGYHVVVSGHCWAELLTEHDAPVALAPGSIVIFPHGDPHVLSSGPHMRAKPSLEVYAPETLDNPLPFRLDLGGDDGRGASILCGFLGCDFLPFNPLLSALPAMVHVADGTAAGDGWLNGLIEVVLREARERRPGSGAMLSKLSELIFIAAVRRFGETRPSGYRGWISGLADPVVGRALRALHGDPARAWTLAELSREAGASRTTLTERFTDQVGVPPMAYLGKWRIQVAAGHMADGGKSMAQVAALVGYDSATAFSHAFKRIAGVSPSEWRRAAKPG